MYCTCFPHENLTKNRYLKRNSKLTYIHVTVYDDDRCITTCEHYSRSIVKHLIELFLATIRLKFRWWKTEMFAKISVSISWNVFFLYRKGYCSLTFLFSFKMYNATHGARGPPKRVTIYVLGCDNHSTLAKWFLFRLLSF